MTRTFVSFPVSNFSQLKRQLLYWSDPFEVTCFLDNNQYPGNYSSYECVLAAGVHKALSAPAGTAIAQLQSFSADCGDWLFGHLGYDLKNETEGLQSGHPDGVGFPDLYFFVPSVVVLLGRDEMRIGSLADDHAQIARAILGAAPLPGFSATRPQVKARLTEADYLDAVNHLLHHIHRGDCYEVNFCQEFYAESVSLRALDVFLALNNLSPNPFGAYYKLNDRYLCCASPERYLKKEGSHLISQPVKGTISRDQVDPVNDRHRREALTGSAKERSENVMIVDLVRNDLSKVCEEGSVRVDELFGLYSFPQVHQMISTVSGTLNKGLPFTEALKATFPMGSMTGAPKKRVMELIEKYEKSRRGLFSGALGYVTHTGDFDFNVVIRSVLYNETSGYLSYQVGSAITHRSEATQEYAECLLKAGAIETVLAGFL